MGNNSGTNFQIPEIPHDIWIEVLLNANDETIKKCLFVNKAFYSIITSQSFWLKRCMKYNIAYPKNLTSDQSKHIDYRRIYFLKPYNRNLIKNPDARSKIYHLLHQQISTYLVLIHD